MKITKDDFKQIAGNFNDINPRSASTYITPNLITAYLPKNFSLSDNKLIQICAALKSGKNIILSGPPGTGKTSIAKAILSASNHLSLSKTDTMVTTATSDWSTFDTVGGYFPDTKGQLVFTPGIILNSLIEDSWMLIDELNRSDIDKAFGQFFTVLSGGVSETILPFQYNNQPIKIMLGNSVSDSNNFYINDTWKIIATMNDLDKLSLYDISYAFLRRFAIIEIDVPLPYEMELLFNKYASKVNVNLPRDLLNIHEQCLVHRPLGPSIYIDMTEFIQESIISFSSDYIVSLKNAYDIFIRPQLQGLLDTLTIDQIISDVMILHSERNISTDNI